MSENLAFLVLAFSHQEAAKLGPQGLTVNSSEFRVRSFRYRRVTSGKIRVASH